MKAICHGGQTQARHNTPNQAKGSGLLPSRAQLELLAIEAGIRHPEAWADHQLRQGVAL